MRRVGRISRVLPLALVLGLVAGQPAVAAETLPFVGCPSDGQLGPIPAPTGAPVPTKLAPAIASGLAFYKAGQDETSVVAPRGWACDYVYGSDGGFMIVAPTDKPETLVDSPLKTQAVVLIVHSGQTSGRFASAEYAARLFPKQARAFIASVMAEGIEPKTAFVFKPYPQDKVTPMGPREIAFETPPGAQGLGTAEHLEPSALPVKGIARLQGDPKTPDFFILSVRLPARPVGAGRRDHWRSKIEPQPLCRLAEHPVENDVDALEMVAEIEQRFELGR